MQDYIPFIAAAKTHGELFHANGGGSFTYNNLLVQAKQIKDMKDCKKKLKLEKVNNPNEKQMLESKSKID